MMNKPEDKELEKVEEVKEFNEFDENIDVSEYEDLFLKTDEKEEEIIENSELIDVINEMLQKYGDDD